PPSLARRRPARSGYSAGSTTRSRRYRWGSSTPWSPWPSWRQRRSAGARRCSSSARSRSGCSSPASTPIWTVRPASRSSPATPRCSTTCPPRPRRAATRTSSGGSPTSRSSRADRDRRRPRRLAVAPDLAARRQAEDAHRRGGAGGGGDRPRGGRGDGGALAGAMLIQIGTNLTNDYYDFRKGADTHERVGPTRVTQSGLIAPQTVLAAGAACFTLAVAVGISLVARGGWPFVVIGLASVLAGWAYTGGPYPLGYHGLGDLFVMVFFGLVAVPGTFYAQALRLV